MVNSGNAGVPDASITILNAWKAVVATAATDVTAFYFLPEVDGLTPGTAYTVKVTLPSGYKNSIPSSQTFLWRGTGITLKRFVLN